MHALHVTYTSSAASAQMREAQIAFAEQLASVPGFVSKTWLQDGTTHGGFYLFDSHETANAFVDGPLFAALRAAPAISDLTVRGYAVQVDLSALTGAGRSLAAGQSLGARS